jgi:hypothetical protein
MFYCAEERALITGDALWENGFGIVLPDVPEELEEARRTLDAIAALDVRVVIPGHGPPFAGVAGALERSFARVDALRGNPERIARNVLKVMLMFSLLDRESIPLATLPDYLASVPIYREYNERYFKQTAAQLADWLVGELEKSRAARRAGGLLLASNSERQSAVPRSLLEGLAHGRHHVLDHAALAQCNFGVDLHTRHQLVAHSVLLEVLGLKFDDAAELVTARAILTIGVLRTRTPTTLLGFSGIRTHLLDHAFDHSVFLERIRRYLKFDRLAFTHETAVAITHPDLGAQRLVRGHDSHQHGAWRQDGAFSMGGKIFDDSSLWRLELQQFIAMRLLLPLLLELLVL